MGIKITKKCIGCGVCVDVCPYSAIMIIEGMAVVEGHCTLCGACAEACLEQAIIIDRPAVKPVAEQDKDQWRGVWVFVETHGTDTSPVSYELLGEGRKLADRLKTDLSAIVLGDGSYKTDDLFARGADKVYSAAHPYLADLDTEICSLALLECINRYKPEIVLAGATSFGRTVMPKVAATLETGLTADCTGLDIDKEKGLLLQTRPTFGGNLMATIVCPDRRPQMATVRPHVFKQPEINGSSQGEKIDVQLAGNLTSRISLLDRVVELVAGEKLEDADIIVAGGRGLGSTEGFEHVKELARLLKGAVGASRAVVDEGWVPYSHQVGQTGKTVCPKLYIACGISGAIQHLAGMQTSDRIVAINRDPDAPIFDVADYGIVGDVKEVLPLLISSLKKEFGQA
jgi:electron transfer flavoprotein alpha subunit